MPTQFEFGLFRVDLATDCLGETSKDKDIGTNDNIDDETTRVRSSLDASRIVLKGDEGEA
tara:strand:- start:38 stop:217 length:180 start_codon:yes stop_codon:yes gene_type:complete